VTFEQPKHQIVRPQDKVTYLITS